ncbi:TetR/AcrR family transcriptional regulator [Nocardia inohanensis]|uniref:TetR/AcrR family transcriptional regulator n=1 Tax=Nocardia inohanensis TaxID=209246 RepID=UPI000830F6E8|nr:TetR/AcrR family transcriptional regulator [Nocardia inohanensis]
MPRPRTHDPDAVLDAAEELAVRAGAAAVTIRAVATATGISNGAIYHTFTSRAELLGRTWIRAATRFLTVQAELVEHETAHTDPAAAVVAAADAPVVFAQRHPHSCALLFSVRREDFLGEDLPEPVRTELDRLDRGLIELLKRLATGMWGRADARAVDTITICVVDLPTAILLERHRLTDRTARTQLRAAVRAVLDIGPAPRRPKTVPPHPETKENR